MSFHQGCSVADESTWSYGKEYGSPVNTSLRYDDIQLTGDSAEISGLSVSGLECNNLNQIANLISKLNFYKLIPYPMDNSLSGRRGPARQTSEKDVLCLHRLGRPSAVHSPDGVSYFLPV